MFVDTLITCLTVKQSDNESLADYSKRFKQHKGILKQMMDT
jgi:cyclopropane fatty-acyl-phospholipid synthase-like methyltransferase